MIKSIEHFSFTVSSLEESLGFFCDKLDLEATPIEEVDHPDVKQILGMPDARLRIALVKLPGDKAIELIQYIHPEGKPLDLSTNNTGVAHIAFEVSDIITLHENLSRQGVALCFIQRSRTGDGPNKVSRRSRRGVEGNRRRIGISAEVR